MKKQICLWFVSDLATSPIPLDSWLLMETNVRKKRTNSCSSNSSSSSLRSISRRRAEQVTVPAKKPVEKTIAIQTGKSSQQQIFCRKILYQ
jgi:hypothetical protein